MKTSIEDYENCFKQGGSEAVWTRVKDRCLTDAERQNEVAAIKAYGWFVLPHFDADHTGEMDTVVFQPPS